VAKSDEFLPRKAVHASTLREEANKRIGLGKKSHGFRGKQTIEPPLCHDCRQRMIRISYFRISSKMADVLYEKASIVTLSEPFRTVISRLDFHPQDPPAPHISDSVVDDGEDDGLDDTEELEELEYERKRKKRYSASVMRKAPQAPKRFKSSYICFFIAKQTEIKESLGEEANVTSISKRSAELWRSLPVEERSHWDEVAAKDKERYNAEKAAYSGPWQVPVKRVKKDPSGERHGRKFASCSHISQHRVDQ